MTIDITSLAPHFNKKKSIDSLANKFYKAIKSLGILDDKSALDAYINGISAIVELDNILKNSVSDLIDKHQAAEGVAKKARLDSNSTLKQRSSKVSAPDLAIKSSCDVLRTVCGILTEKYKEKHTRWYSLQEVELPYEEKRLLDEVNEELKCIQNEFSDAAGCKRLGSELKELGLDSNPALLTLLLRDYRELQNKVRPNKDIFFTLKDCEIDPTEFYQLITTNPSRIRKNLQIMEAYDCINKKNILKMLDDPLKFAYNFSTLQAHNQDDSDSVSFILHNSTFFEQHSKGLDLSTQSRKYLGQLMGRQDREAIFKTTDLFSGNFNIDHATPALNQSTTPVIG